VTILIMAQNGIVGQGLESPVDLSYLADNVILLRYFETSGEVRHAISVMKKRTGAHEKTVRECRIGPPGFHVGRQLRDFDGVLTGQPVYSGSAFKQGENGPGGPHV
jgi:circadian clock protein KaiC